MQIIAGFDRFTLDGQRYEWNPTLGEYWSLDGEARVLQEHDAALLLLDSTPIAVADPASIGIAFKQLSDPSFHGRSEDEQRRYLAESGPFYGVDDWTGQLAWVCGEHRGTARMSKP